jgi:hypothetical protein
MMVRKLVDPNAPDSGIDTLSCNAGGHISLASDPCFTPGDDVDAFDDCSLSFDLASNAPRYTFDDGCYTFDDGCYAAIQRVFNFHTRVCHDLPRIPDASAQPFVALRVDTSAFPYTFQVLYASDGPPTQFLRLHAPRRLLDDQLTQPPRHGARANRLLH